MGGVFWILWLALAGLVPLFWPRGPRPLPGLLMLAPLSLLAAGAVADLADRKISVRTLGWLAPLTVVCIAWRHSESLRAALNGLLHGRLDIHTALGLHLALDLFLAVVLITRGLDRWARRRDDRQRKVLGGFLTAIFVITAATGIREVTFRHSETNDLLMLRTMVLRRHRVRPFDLLAVVTPDAASDFPDAPSPGGRLRFILQSALPELPQRDLAHAEDLLGLPEGQRLVILSGSRERLSYAEQSRLGLEAIHPGRSGILDAFATADSYTTQR